MEEDYRSASKRFWQTVRRLRRGKQYSANTVYSAGGELLTSINWGHCRTVEEILRGSPQSHRLAFQVRKRRLGTLRWTRPSPEPEVTEVVRKLLSLPGKVYARVLERRIRPIVEPSDSGGTMRFSSLVVEHWTSSILSCRVLEGLWEFAQPVHMCFVDLEKAFDRVPRGILWGVLREYGVRGPLLRAVIRSLYDRSRSLVPHCRHQDLQHVLERFAAECEAAGMRISTSKSEAMVLDRKRGWRALSGWVERSCLKWRSSSISGSCSRVRERWSVRLTGGLVQRPQLCASVYRTVVVKKELSRKALKRSSIYASVNLRSHPHLWS
ncbi:hypothetical protein L3Q82_014641 [Scortum barcoo]|uniref:Uncharacterized protein n=1 Tax=Scortum barcoo TaxID=214431 RepID=A0ACB8VXW0_9TELE|nr:hypothetical protein L3Q82_014641 [Scortum barcoo]